MRFANALLGFSALTFAGIGVGYLIAPAAMLSIVGITSAPVADFLIRTIGVALLAGAGLIASAWDASATRVRIALVSLAGYYLLSSVVDWQAHSEGIVGSASVPSVMIRVAVGVLCLLAAWRVGRDG